MSIRSLAAIGIVTALSAVSVSGATVTVTTPEELLTKAASLENNGELVVASPDGTYPVVFKMTDTLVVNASTYSHIIRGATGDPKDVILDFSAKPMQGVRLKSSNYHYPSMLASVTVQNATNNVDTSGNAKGGGIYTENAVVSNCVVRGCRLESSANATITGGGIYAHCGKWPDRVVVDCVVYDCSVVSTYAQSSGWSQSVAGGGIYKGSGTVIRGTVVSNCTVSAQAVSMSSGGAAIASVGAMTLLDCRLEACTHEASGFTAWAYSGAVSTLSLIATNCLFKGNSGYRGSAVYQRSTVADIAQIADCTFESNTGAYALYMENNKTVAHTVRNCKFVNNAGAVQTCTSGSTAAPANVVSSYFSGNVAETGAAIYGGSFVSNCVFSANEATGEGGGAITMQNMANYAVVDCLFKDNASAGLQRSGGGAIRVNCTTGTAYTNLSVRSCYFKGNSGATRDIAIQNLRGQSEAPTWENHQGINIESCTFADGLAGTYAISGGTESAYACAGSVFARNCHFTGSSGKGAVNPNFYESYADAVLYCVADTDMTNLPTTEGLHNAFGTRVKNVGQNLDWMTGSYDLGDGTYTLGTELDYGVTITFNNRKHRINDHVVDIGCFEAPASGLTVIFR